MIRLFWILNVTNWIGLCLHAEGDNASGGGAPDGSSGADGGKTDKPDPNPATVDAPPPDATPPPDPKGTVAYETHRTLLSEKKKRDEENRVLREQIAARDKADKEREDAKLLENEDYKKMVENRDQTIVEKDILLKEKDETLTGLKSRETNAQKISAFLDTLAGDVRSCYWDKIDIAKIPIDPDTGEVDAMAVTQQVEIFKKEYPELITGLAGPKLPNGAPPARNAGAGTLTYEAWLKLPAAEMKARKNEVIKPQ